MSLKDVDLNLLAVFHAIYEARSISAAATQLDLSQPGMSHALKRLRTQMDDKLFVRKGNGVQPTVYAESIAEPIRNAINSLAASLSPEEDFDPRTSTRHFQLLMADFVEPLVMPRILQLTCDNPNITFEMHSPQSLAIEEAVLEGNVDLVVHLQADMMHEISVDPLFSVKPIPTYRLGHPISREPDPMASYFKYRQLSPNLKPGMVRNFDKIKVNQAHPRDSFCFMHSLRSTPALLAESDCVAMLPTLYAFKVAPVYGLDYTRIPFDILQQDVTLSWHRKNDSNKALLWLRAVIKDTISELEAEATKSP